MEEIGRDQVVAFRLNIRELLLRPVSEAVKQVLEEELSLALGASTGTGGRQVG